MDAAELKDYIERLQSNSKGLEAVDFIDLGEPEDEYYLWSSTELAALNRTIDRNILEIAKALQDNESVRKLRLRLIDEGLKIDGAGAIAIGQALMKNRHIESIEIATPYFADNDAVRTVLLALQQNDKIKKVEICGYYDFWIEYTDNRSSLDDCTMRVVAGLLESNSTIEELGLTTNALNDVAVVSILCPALKKNRSIKLLDACDNMDLGGRGAMGLCDAIRDKGKVNFDFRLSSVPCFQVSELIRSNSIGALTLHRYATAIPENSLHVLADAMHQNATMEKFDLMFTASSDDELQRVPSNSGFARMVSAALRPVSNVRRLSLTRCNLGNVKALAEVLTTQNETLEELCLRDCAVDDAGAIALAEAITANTRLPLKLLDLSFNRVGDAGAIAIARLLHSPTVTVENLSMSCNSRFGASAYDAFAEALKVNTVLKLLHVGGPCDDVGFRAKLALVDALRHNDSLENLQLPYMKRETTDSEKEALNRALYQALQFNHTITDIWPFKDDKFHGKQYLEMNKKGVVAACTSKGLPFPSHLIRNLADCAIPRAIERANELAGLGGIYSFVQQMHVGVTAGRREVSKKRKGRPS